MVDVVLEVGGEVVELVVEVDAVVDVDAVVVDVVVGRRAGSSSSGDGGERNLERGEGYLWRQPCFRLNGRSEISGLPFRLVCHSDWSECGHMSSLGK
jgi:hypothetical protein